MGGGVDAKRETADYRNSCVAQATREVRGVFGALGGGISTADNRQRWAIQKI